MTPTRASATRKPTARETAWANADLDALKISPEVADYMCSHGYRVPTCPPLIKTPEPAYTKTAAAKHIKFDGDRVEHVINTFRQLRHTKGHLAGRVFEPDNWQVAYVLAPWAGWVIKSPDTGVDVRVITTLYVDLPRKNGKLEAIDTPQLTDHGWVKFGDLRVGDKVHAEDGTLVPISYISPAQTPRCYIVTFADGQKFTVGAEHLWTVRDRYGHDPVEWAKTRTKGAWVTVDTDVLYRNHRCGARRDTRYSVRTDRVLQRPEAKLAIDPYLLGVWLGDGDTGSPSITKPDVEIGEAFERCGYVITRRDNGNDCPRFYVRGFVGQLRELGVLGNKHVPQQFLLASADQRMALLRGLMDTDGGVNRGPNTPRVEFCSTTQQLAESVLFLARSMGWKATIKESRARLYGEDYGPRWRVAWTAFREYSPFTLARKTNCLVERPDRDTRSVTNTIVKVESTGSVECRCIQVDHPSRQYLTGEGLTPTHNTTLAGGIALYMTGADDEFGAQVLAAATTKDQAAFVFEPMRQLVVKSGLRAYLKPFKYKITHTASGSYFQPIANAGDAQHGADIHCSVIDELHLHKEMTLIDALETGTGSRTQPLTLFITTADAGKRHTPYALKRERVEKLARGILKDATSYGVIFAAEKPIYENGKLVGGDDPYSVATLKKANPGYGVSPTIRYLKGEAAKAKESPADLGRFLRLHLGIRTKQETRYIDIDEWDINASIVVAEDLKGRYCYGGLDLGSTSDLTALVWVFPDEDRGGFDVLPRFWTPEDNIENLDDRTAKAASTEWIPQGWLRTTPGNVTDYDFIKSQIDQDLDDFEVQEIAYDPWNALQLTNDLMNDGAPMATFRQGFVSMSAPTKELQRFIKLGCKLDRKGLPIKPMVRHGGNPVLRWMVDNLAVAMDEAGNVKPDKINAGDKIDGVVALIMGLGRALANAPDDSEAWGVWM